MVGGVGLGEYRVGGEGGLNPRKASSMRKHSFFGYQGICPILKVRGYAVCGVASAPAP